MTAGFGERMMTAVPQRLGSKCEEAVGGLMVYPIRFAGLGLQFGIWVEPEMVNMKKQTLCGTSGPPLRFRDSLIRKEETSGF